MDLISLAHSNSMVGTNRIRDVEVSLTYCLENNINGDYVECGTWRGGLAALMLSSIITNNLSKRLWLYDTFQGMSRPGENDVAINGEQAVATFQAHFNETTGFSEWCKASTEVVEETLNTVSSDYKQYTKFIIGTVEETLTCAENIPEKIALLRLDTDWYESTRVELEILYPRLSQNGIVIIDDYGWWQGQKKATDEFLSRLNPNNFTTRNGADHSLIIEKLI